MNDQNRMRTFGGISRQSVHIIKNEVEEKLQRKLRMLIEVYMVLCAMHCIPTVALLVI